MSLPALLLVAADNQLLAAIALRDYSGTIEMSGAWDQTLFVNRFSSLVVNMKLREDISMSGRKAVDGSGASRVIASILHEFPSGIGQ